MHAAFADMQQNIGNYVVSALAVAGAGVIGYLLTLFLLWLISKFAFDKKLPKPVTRLVGILGGVALALLVFGLLFNGGGGGGWGLGPGLGFGTGSGTGEEKQKQPDGKDAGPPKTPRQDSTEITGNEAGAATPLQVLMLGGDRVKGTSEAELTYYQVLPDGKAYNLADLKSLIRERKNNKPPIRELLIIIRSDSVSHDHPAVKRLETFVHDEGLAIRYQKPE